MIDVEKQINELVFRLEDLQRRQTQMSEEMFEVERKLEILQAAFYGNDLPAVKQENMVAAGEQTSAEAIPYILQVKKNIEQKKVSRPGNAFYLNREMEDFIGTNVISKVGILVTIIGVFIGAKYAIDNELVSPFVRILAGYLAGAALVVIAFKLKAKYEYFSSILIGGGLAVTYFITYIAYSFYSLFPLAIAFALMIVTTAAAVAIALWYNQKVIAIIGQVAAYAIPFLLGNGNGNIFILFSYITVINLGLLLLSFKKQWKILYHLAFFLTWFIYLASVVFAGRVTGSFTTGLIFLAIHFITFYITFLSYKIFRNELYHLEEIAILLLNALFFFFLGTYLINESFNNIHYITGFTIINAVVHFIAGYAIYKRRLVDQSVFQFILGLGLLFFTIAIPIELDGSWVTILWTIEGAALCYVAYNSKRELYLDVALPLIIACFISILQDWYTNYPFIRRFGAVGDYRKLSFLNINFTFSLFVSACVGAISWMTRKSTVGKSFFKVDFYRTILPVAFLVIFYFTIFNEIHYAWDQNMVINHDKAAPFYQSISLFIFSCLYFSGWNLTNSYKLKNGRLHHLLIVLSLLVNLSFLFNILYSIGELRDFYIANPRTASISLLGVRYFCIGALAILWLSAKKTFTIVFPQGSLLRPISTVFNITLLAIISNEFIHWMDLAGYQNQYKLGLSLICGAYALVLLFTGLMKKKKHLRLSAMVLFAATLLKLFFYDLASLSTISKTIVLVLLGVLLLLASFLYNKYKELLFVDEEKTK